MVIIAPISLPITDLLFTTENTQLIIEKKIIGSGTAYIRENSLSWQPANFPQGISIPWKQISVHAISLTPRKCIYLTLDHKLDWQGPYESNVIENGHGNLDNGQVHEPNTNDDDEGNASDEEVEITECWLIPNDANAVDALYQSMCDCQAMHPDSAESISSESDFDMDNDGGTDDDDEVGPSHRSNDVTQAQGSMRNLSLEDNRWEDAD